MPSINQLSRSDRITAGDVIAAYINNQGDARGVAVSVLLDFMQQNLSFSASAYDTEYAAPNVSGFNVAVNVNTKNTHLLLTPTSAFAAGTITLPPISALADKQMLLVTTTQAITALSMAGSGAFIFGAPLGMAAGAYFTIKFDMTTKTWYRVS